MRARRFQGPTVSAAYEQVRAVLGDDAVIISTRNATAPGELGSGAREFVEVVAGIPETAESDRDISLRPLAQDIAAHDLVRGLAEQAAARAAGTPEVELAPPFLNSMAGSARGGPFDAIGRGSAEPSGQPPTSAVELPEALDHALLANLSVGLQEVRALLEQLTRERLTAPVEVGAATLAELRDCLLTHGVRHSLLLPLLDDIAHSITPDASGEAVQQAAETALEAQLPPPITLDLARRPHAIFIVGPAGAGKTTAAIRLGMQLTQQGLRVAVAGTNVERAGAPQQLEAFGAAAGLRVRTCYTPGELQALIADGASDVVIVDTVGHNGARTDRMAELGAFLQVARERTVLLALPATMQGEDLLRLTRAFARVHPGGLLLTRCDETETFGGLWSAVKQCGVGIAYTTHNDAVGELAHPGDNHALAAAVQQGQWPARVTASSFGRRAG